MFKPTVTLRTLRQKQLPSFEIWLTLDGIFSNCSKGRSVGNVEFGSLRAFKTLRADQLGWNLASIGKEEGTNEPTSLFVFDFILNLSESMEKQN